jgi:catechol 2,3-dioxygenase-like lactoylglutathione lyase family enzyme
MALIATELDDEESAEKLIILPNFAGDPIILPVKSKQKPKQKIAQPAKDSVVVGDMLIEDLVQKVSDKQVAKKVSNEELVRKATSVEELSDNGESYTTSLSQSHKSDDVEIRDPLDVNEKAPIVTDSAVSKDNGDGEDGPRKIKLVDYASKLAGAQILEQSPSLKGSSNLLTGDKDKYSIAPCMDKKYIVIGLSEDILVKQIILSNYERYSSRVKKFQVLASQEYPTPSEDYWNSIGTYEAHSKSGEQAFELLEPTWARYLKIRFLSHYGSEHYCTLSQIKVHGSTMLQGFHEQWIESEKKDWESGQEDGAIVKGGEESEAKPVGEERNVDIEGSIEEDTEVVEDKVNKNIMGDGESVSVDDSSTEVTQNKREADATDDSSTVAIDYEVQNEVVSRTTVVGERGGRKKSDDPQEEIVAYSTQEIGEEELSFVGEEVGINQLLSEIDLDVKHLVEAAAAEHRGVDVEEGQAQIAEPNTDNDISEEESTSISDYTEHQKVASNMLDPINLEREYETAKGADDPKRNDSVINSSLDYIKSLTDTSDVEKLDSLRTNVSSVMSSMESSDYDEEGDAVQNLSDTKIEENALAETPKEHMNDAIFSQATDETAKDYSKPIIGIANNYIKLEKGIPISKDDSKAASNRGLIEHDTLSDTDKDDKERRGMEKSTGELYTKLSRRFPHASCLQDLEFQAFKSKALPVHTGSAGSAGGGAKMEPIFTKITSEIKLVQITQHQYEQFISALKVCYDEIFLDMVKDLDSIQERFDQRLSNLEREDFVSVMRTNDHSSPSSFGVFAPTFSSMMHSFGLSSVFASTFISMMHQVVGASRIQEHSNVLCAVSVAICLLLLLLWRTARRNDFRSPGDKIIRNSVCKANGKTTAAQLASQISYNSNHQKNDRNRTIRHICQIPEVAAEDYDLPPELIAENGLIRELIAENNLLKKKAARRLNFQNLSESVHISSPLTMFSLRPPFRLSHIDHVVIRCRNFPVMFDFYHRILGCSIDEPIDSHVGRFGGALTHLRAGSCYIDLLTYDTRHLTDEGCEAVARMHSGGAGLDDGNGIADVNFSPEPSTLDHLCLRIDPFDRDRLLDYFEDLNVNIVKRATAGDTRLGADGVGPSLYLRDPEGNVIELKGRPSVNTAKSILDEKVSLMP